AMINAKLAANTQDYWIERLNAAGVPAGKVLAVSEVLADPQIEAQEMVIDVDHGQHGVVRMTGFPVKLSDTPARVRHPAPGLGANTDDILQEAGFTADEIAALRQTRSIR